MPEVASTDATVKLSQSGSNTKSVVMSVCAVAAIISWGFWWPGYYAPKLSVQGISAFATFANPATSHGFDTLQGVIGLTAALIAIAGTLLYTRSGGTQRTGITLCILSFGIIAVNGGIAVGNGIMSIVSWAKFSTQAGGLDLSSVAKNLLLHSLLPALVVLLAGLLAFTVTVRMNMKARR